MTEIVDPQQTLYEAYKFRMSGEPWEEVARMFGFRSALVAEVQVTRYVQGAMVRISNNHKDEVVQLELARLDALQKAHWTNAVTGDLKSGEFVLKVMDARAKYLKLYDERELEAHRTIVINGDEKTFIEQVKEIANG